MMCLNKKIKKILKDDAISLHVPGHHNNTIGSLNCLNIEMDMTEITGLDDLHQPEEVLSESMALMNRYSTYDSQYLVNGTTVGILSVIYAVKDIPGDILIPRNAHKSIYNALKLTGQKATWMPMTISQETNQYDGVQGVEELDLKHVKLAIFTYPNYYGEIFDIQKKIDILHTFGIPVLVDEAHGAHFGISSDFPCSSLQYGADIVVQSYHKTLPALTMGSVIYMNKGCRLNASIRSYLRMLQTSSPSYLIMSSLERAEHFYKNFEDAHFKEKRQRVIQELEHANLTVGVVEDPLKLTVSHPFMSGYAIQELFERHNIYVELANSEFVLLVLPLWHESDRYPFDGLINRIQHFEFTYEAEVCQSNYFNLPVESNVYEPYNIEKSKLINLEDAISYTSARDIVPYPPGIPVIFEGEIIKQSMVDSLLHWIDSGGRVEGIVDKKIMIKDVD